MTLLDKLFSFPYYPFDLLFIVLLIISAIGLFVSMIMLFDYIFGDHKDKIVPKINYYIITATTLITVFLFYFAYIYFIEDITTEKMKRLIDSGYITKEYSDAIIVLDNKRINNPSDWQLLTKKPNVRYPAISHYDINSAIRTIKSDSETHILNKERKLIRDMLRDI